MMGLCRKNGISRFFWFASIWGLLLISGGCAERQEPAAVFEYQSVMPPQFPNQAFILPQTVDGEGAVRLGQDAYEPAEFCPQSEEFYCIFSNTHVLAVPKNFTGHDRQWQFRGVIFIVEKTNISFELLGRKFTGLALIRVPSSASVRGQRSGKDMLYLYSPICGVVSFEESLGPRFEIPSTYWSVGEIGFGASRSEKTECKNGF